MPFIGIEIVKNGTNLETQVYGKPTHTLLLLHFQSHTDKRYRLFIKNNDILCLCLVVYNRGFQYRMCQVALYI